MQTRSKRNTAGGAERVRRPAKSEEARDVAR